MKRLVKIVFLVLLSSVVVTPGFSQLRKPSPYFQDRINPEATHFALHDRDTAVFQWASEWTQTTARSYDYMAAIFLWHFKDGTKAYAKQVDYVGDFGMRRDYFAMNSASALTDKKGNAIQPMTLDNYPIRIELWIGTADDTEGFGTETLIDAVCFESDKIEYGEEYLFNSQCQ